MASAEKHLKIFKCLSDETRFRIFRLLLEKGELCVCEIEQALDLPQYTISRGLKSLNDSGLAAKKKEGLWRLYSIPLKSDDFLKSLFNFIRKTIPPEKRDLKRLDLRPDIRMEVYRCRTPKH
ncbi:MAG: metalloregulator ArsR/SmtB family transcription factor [bacterium]